MSMLRRLGIRAIIYLDDILIMAASREELIAARDTTIFLLHHLGLTINHKKSEFDPTKLIEFLGVMVDSQAMTLSLPMEKVQKLRKLCQDTLISKQVTLHELSSLIGKLRATAPAILVAPLQLRYLQNLLKRGQQLTWNYGTIVPLDKDCVIELKWWRENLGLCKGKPLLIDPPDLIIQSDAAKTGGWGASCGPTQTGGTWNVREANLNINIQELIAAELAIKTFTKSVKVKSIHIQIDNTAALSYLVKMGGTGNMQMNVITKRIWNYLVENNISLTAEWIPTHLNIWADWESRHSQDSSEWKLCPSIFHRVCQKFGKPNLDLFASRNCHQLQRYVSWKPDPLCLFADAFSQRWEQFLPYAFPPFCLITRVVRKVSRDQVPHMILVTPLWSTQPWYPCLLGMSIENPIILPRFQNLLRNPNQESHPLIRDSNLTLVAWSISGLPLQQEEFRRTLPKSSQTAGPKELELLTAMPGISGWAGAIRGRLIPLIPL